MNTRQALQEVKKTVPQVIEQLPSYELGDLKNLIAKCIAERIGLVLTGSKYAMEAVEHIAKLQDAAQAELKKRQTPESESQTEEVHRIRSE